MAESVKRQGGDAWKWLVSALISSVPFFFQLSFELKIFLAISIAALMLWIFEVVSEAVVGLLIPVLYVLFKVATPAVAFNGWAQSTPWITIGGLMVGTAFTSSGLVKRLAYKMLVLTGGTLHGLVFGLAATCIILTPVIPSIMAKCALMTPIVIGFCQVLGLEKKSRTASVLMLVVFLSLWSPKMAFLTASADSVMTAGILREHYSYPLSWFGWAQAMFVPAMLWTFISIPLVYFLRPEKIKLDKAYLLEQYASLGPFSWREKKCVILVTILILGMATDTLHHIEATWLMMLAGSLCFFPGVALLKTEDFNKIQFSVVFFLVGAVSIGSVTSSLGLAAVIVKLITPLFADKSSLMLVMSLYFFSIIINFTINPLALIGTFMGPVADVFTSLGYPAILGGYTMIMGFNQGLFPYQIAPLMLVYGFGYLKLGHLVKVMLIRIFVGIVFIPLVAYPYWKMIGLMN